MNQKLLLKALPLIAILFSVGCVASGITTQKSSFVVWGGFFLVLSGIGLPLYMPLFTQKNQAFESETRELWHKIARFLGLRFYKSDKETSLPSIYGVYKNHSISVSQLKDNTINYSFQDFKTKIHIPILNPNLFYLSVRDSSFDESENSFFQNRVYFLTNNQKFENRFIIKTNQENSASIILNQSLLQKQILKLPDSMIEISGQSLTLVTHSEPIDEQKMKFLLDFLVNFVNVFDNNLFNKAA